MYEKLVKNTIEFWTTTLVCSIDYKIITSILELFDERFEGAVKFYERQIFGDRYISNALDRE